MRKEIRSINPFSAGKVGCLLGGLLTAIFGCFFLFLPMVAMPGLLASAAPDQSSALHMLGGGLVGALAIYIAVILIEAVAIAVVWLIGALIYNLVAKIAGGLEIDLDAD
ncbi:MAG TPA: hypothetical protein ENJ54_03070 [Chloroflexi bacterium]|nr:hypothetical protein [Chloroflexota bacterium]